MKRFICLVLTFVCLFTVTSYAGTTFKDVEDTIYKDSVDKLVSFGIINGFEDGTFKPKDSVTRAQLAKMLTIAMGVSEDEVNAAKKKFLSFPDVLSSHWAYGYIKVAADKGLINGFEDGTFKPDDTVSYAQATTMFLRALDYTTAVDDSLGWPNNYMVYADEELDLFEGMPEFKASSPASRGDIAFLLWNTLRTGVSEIVGENNKGLVYGPGTPMITEYLKYFYIEDAEVTKIEFDDRYKTAKVTLKEEDKVSQKVEVTAEEALEMYGRKVTLLLNSNTNEILDYEYKTDYKVVKGEITNISNSKIYISSRANPYNAPDKDNILLYGIEYLDDAVEVIMLVDGNSAKYCVAMGASEAFPGYVPDNNVEISEGEYGIRLRKVGVTKGGDEFYVANENAWPADGAVILYYINSEDLLVVLDEIKYNDASEIVDIDDDFITIAGDDKYEFTDDSHSVIFVNSSSLKAGELSDIDINLDTAIVKEYAAHVYIFVYEDDILDSLDDELVEALYDLEDAIEDALELDEEDYTQESYAKLMEEVAYGQKLNYTSSKTRVKNAVIDIEDAIADLDDDVSKNEKKITSMKKELRALINDECAKIISDEFDYTDESYEDFEDMYEWAVEVLEMYDATLEDVEDAYDDLDDAIDDLELLED